MVDSKENYKFGLGVKGLNHVLNNYYFSLFSDRYQVKNIQN